MTQRQFYDPSRARALMIASKPFAKARIWRTWFQLVVVLGLFCAMVGLASWGGALVALVLAPVMTGVFIRIFVLQHDCGHRSLFQRKRANDWCGVMLSVLTSVPYHAWRTEHQWHHNHQGKLSKRGVDNMNSPMTVDEVPQRPKEASFRINKINPINIFLIGMHSLLIERKAASGFFPFRETFVDHVRNKRQMLVGIAYTIALHVVFQLFVVFLLGWWVSALLLLPAMAIGSGIGALLFWVQHNFEETYYAENEQWHKTNVAVFGSSYLKMHPILRWFTADIGIHHVHHLNPRIPNYHLELARCAIEGIRDVQPMDRDMIRRSFSHLFWDRQAKRMKSPQEIGFDSHQ